MQRQSNGTATRLALAVAIPVLVVALAMVGSRLVPASAGNASSDSTVATVVSYVYSNQFGGTNPPAMAGTMGIAHDPSGNVYVVDEGDDRIEKFDPSGKPLGVWGSSGSGNGQFNGPAGIAVDGNDDVYVVDEFNNRVQKFDSSGKYITQWGGQGSGVGQFSFPIGVAADSSGNVYVADSGNYRIQKFDPSGAPIAQWGSAGSGDGQFATNYGPYDVAVDNPSLGNVYVTDNGNSRIEKFDATGKYLAQWSTSSSYNGQLWGPSGIAVDADGTFVYVTVSPSLPVQKFTSSGSLVTQWGTPGSDNGQFLYPGLITVNTSGNNDSVYVADPVNDRIQEFTSSGTYVTQWGYSALGAPQGIALDAGGNVDVADNVNSRVQRFTPAGLFLTRWRDTGFVCQIDGGVCTTYYLNHPDGVAIDPTTGNTYVADTENNQIVEYDLDGNPVLAWSAVSSSQDQLSWPWGVAVDASTPAQVAVYVADFCNNRIAKFNSAGTPIAQWGGPPPAQPTPPCPTTTPTASPTPTATPTPVILFRPGAFSSQPSSYPTPRPAPAIGARRPSTSPTRLPLVLTPTTVSNGGARRGGSNLTQQVAQTSLDCPVTGPMDRPVGVAVDASGNVYVAEYGNNRVDKFTSSGSPITQWGCQGSENGQFFNPYGIAFDAAGSVFVADYGGNRVEKFDSNGNYLAQFGTFGSGNGQLDKPTFLTVDASGNVYVSDQTNNRVQVFAPVTLTPTATTTPSPSATPTATPTRTTNHPPEPHLIYLPSVGNGTSTRPRRSAGTRGRPRGNHWRG